jgi:hypothetical protein
LPTEFQNMRMDTELGRDPLQLVVGLDVIPKFQPALGGEQVVAVGRLKRRVHPFNS